MSFPETYARLPMSMLTSSQGTQFPVQSTSNTKMIEIAPKGQRTPEAKDDYLLHVHQLRRHTSMHTNHWRWLASHLHPNLANDFRRAYTGPTCRDTSTRGCPPSKAVRRTGQILRADTGQGQGSISSTWS